MDNLNTRPIPAEYIPVISAKMLERTVSELDAGIEDILKAGQAKETAYANKRELIKRKYQLDTEIDLVEADAFMLIEGEARSQYVMIGDKKVALGNDQARDAYRRTSSKELRQQMAAVEGEIAAIDTEIAKAQDKWYTAKDANDNVRAKANIQASLLQFLGGR